jgi:hypothetical protein
MLVLSRSLLNREYILINVLKALASIISIVTDLLKEFIGNASVNTAITQQ